ncbi:MAG: hypothetical protein P857_803 [Candidatus Xenolissoclinum pacificiensis L6]|uniref:Uncharacterized protein n=1 Tax=Candidatus Xenolissoclinum pacificiensis L6 TaxID=1401685 RepID=W2V2G2_9RICK|nr:MAG: hypothetical protein P857_803 [Candidatus Xenolissoclinum pacificiensis L6]
MLKEALNFFFPIVCVICKTECNSSICTSCYRTMIQITSETFCIVCAKKLRFKDLRCIECSSIFHYFHDSKSLFLYEKATREIVKQLKFYRNTYVAKIMAVLIVKKFRQYIENYDIIIPVPSSKQQIFKRSFNPASLLAMHISKKCNVKYVCNFLTKKHHTRSQHTIKNKETRLQNIRGSFAVRKSPFFGSKVLIIDDVITTGATIHECAKSLYNHVSSIGILSFARVLL